MKMKLMIKTNKYPKLIQEENNSALESNLKTSFEFHFRVILGFEKKKQKNYAKIKRTMNQIPP